MRYTRILSCFLAVLTVILCFASCKKEDDVQSEAKYYDVTFNSAGGSPVDSMNVLGGTKISAPKEPTREGYIFDGWKHNSVEWIFGENSVNENITLVASWIDAKSIFEYKVVDKKVILTKYKGKLSNFKIPTSIDGIPITAIGDEAFSGISNEDTKKIILGENIVSVGNSAFYGCTGIEICVEGKPDYVGEKAFFGCDRLESITFGDALKVIPIEAFSGCVSLKTVVLSSTVEVISENAFENCTSLVTVTFHDSLKSVKDSAFLNCTSLKAIYYYGNAQSFSKTDISKGNNGNDSLLNAKFYMYSAQKPSDDAKGEYWHFEDNGNIRIW